MMSSITWPAVAAATNSPQGLGQRDSSAALAATEVCCTNRQSHDHTLAQSPFIKSCCLSDLSQSLIKQH